MAKVDLYEFSDVLECSEGLGYQWNQAHKILVDDGIPPMNEMKTKDFYLEDLDHNYDKYGDNYSDDTVKILRAFFKQENLTEFIMI